MVELIKKEEKSDWRKFHFNIPIMESFRDEVNDFMIKGVAINSTVTRNNTFFSEKELERATPTLRNVPILKDHNNSVDSIVGRTVESQYDIAGKNVQFVGRVTDEKMQRMIEQGNITAVSVGARVEDLKEMEDNPEVLSVEGLEFVELSLVAVPADPNAGFAKAVAESYKLKQKIEDNTEKIEEVEEQIEEKTKIIKTRNIDVHIKLGDKATLSIPR